MKTPVGFLIVLCCLLLVPFMSQAFTAFADQQDDGKEAITQWEHKSVPYHRPYIDNELSKQFSHLGDEGWQLVCVSTMLRDGSSSDTIYYFKRPK